MADDLMMMFQSITTADHDELVDQFAHLLQLDTNTATFFLESSNWNVETAVNNYLATMEPALFHDRAMRQQQQQQQHSDDLAMDDDDDQAAGHHDSHSRGGFDAQFVTDLSAAQNTMVPPNTAVDMQWSFVNTGTLPWPHDTHLVFAQGDSFDGPVQVPVADIATGARIDLAIRLRTPSQTGSFSGSWRLVSSQGPIGEPLWLVLTVGVGGPFKQEPFDPAAAVAVGGVTATPTTMGCSNTDDDMMDL